MIDVEIFDRGKWRRMEQGPFPITSEQLDKARGIFQTELMITEDRLSGIHMAPQTTARAILREVAPHLDDFDAICVGYAVSAARIRTSEVKS